MKNIVIILSFFIFYCTGCGFLNDSEEFEGAPHGAYILSISDDRPAEVTIGWVSYTADGCGSATGVSAERDSNNIYLTIKESIYTGTGGCTDAVEEIYGEFTVKNLEVGEYIIKGNDDNTEEFGWLRIEPEAAYSFVDTRRPFFRTKAVTPNDEEHIGDTYQVTVSFRLPGWYNCEPIIKTDIERTQDVIDIEAWQVVPETDCQMMLDTLTDQYRSKFIDIDLGTFSAGSYTVIINDIEDTFEIPPPFTN